MGNLSKYRSGSPYKLGDLRLMNAAIAPRYFVEDGQEWLQTGTLRSNAGNVYGDLLTKYQNGYGVHALLSTDYTFSGNGPGASSAAYSNVSDIYFLTTKYIWMPPPAGATMQWAHSTNLTAWTRQSPVGGSDYVVAHCKVGSVVVAVTNAASPGNLQSIADATGAGTNRGGTATASFVMAASNGTNLAVVATSGSSSAANAIATTTDGTTFTNRTGSSGAVTGMRGLHYAAHLGQFLLWGQGTASDKTAILKSADGYTLSVARAEATDYTLYSYTYGGSQHYAASSPSATLISAVRTSDGLPGFLRTTDGTTWAFVSPWLSDSRGGSGATGAVPTTVQCVRYDSVRGRFYIPLVNAGPSTAQSDNAAYLYSTDGITWSWSGALGAGIKTFAGFANPNGQDLAIVADTNNSAFTGSNCGLVPGTKLVGTPNYVGTVRQMAPGGVQPTHNSGVLNPCYFVRIK